MAGCNGEDVTVIMTISGGESTFSREKGISPIKHVKTGQYGTVERDLNMINQNKIIIQSQYKMIIQSYFTLHYVIVH